MAQQGVAALVLDVDNTLTAHGSQELPAEGGRLAGDHAGGGRGPDDRQQQRGSGWRRLPPGWAWIGRAAQSRCPRPTVRKKNSGVEKARMAIVGDQLFTDRLAGALYGIPALVVTPARRTLTGAFVQAQAGTAVLRRYYKEGKAAVSVFSARRESESFRAAGHKTSLEVPAYTAGMGLDAFEYQCGRGVRLKEERRRPLRPRRKKHGIYFSLHAPYYISMAAWKRKSA